MKIGPNFNSFNISANGMGVQKKRMDLVAENIANTGTTKTEDGSAYKRKFLSISYKDTLGNSNGIAQTSLKLRTRNADHMELGNVNGKDNTAGSALSSEIFEDDSAGEVQYMPDHPDADAEGYVKMPNVNVVTEMVDMIAATRNYEANLTAFNAAKQLAKDSLEI
ncbi:MAG: flagellar basal body rod protein FlgC [Melioribacteraceae bacterium]|nr:flagellar basal body rod protein FlgC [Melioribacteraceae bacterium]